MPPLRRLLTDPLVIFFILGGACFAAWEVAEPETATIVVTDRVVRLLTDDFLVLEGRPPTQAERDELVERWVDDQILFREALARGMHLNDPKTEHRLVDKMRFLLTETPEPPSEQALLDHYLQNASDYYTERRISFEHRFFEDPELATPALLARLRRDEPVTDDPFWMGRRFSDYHASILRGSFGVPFTDALAEAPTGRWVGPLESDRGTHFVRVTEVVEPRIVPFAAARQQVESDWIESRRRASVEAALADLEAGYRVEQPPR